MAPRPKPSKRDAILNAMLALVVERGFHDAPMSLLVERSGASTGVIYHYFASKEEIIQALYQRIRDLKVEALLGDLSPEQDPQEGFVQACLNLYKFYRKHKTEMRFYEQCEHAGFDCQADVTRENERVATFARRFCSKSRGGVLKDWPADVLEELTLGQVSRLASQQRKLSDSVLREIASGMWLMVAAE